MFCGVQFDYPLLMKRPAKNPKNVIFVNNRLEAEVMLIKVMHLKKSSRNCNFVCQFVLPDVRFIIFTSTFADHIIVYGDNSECYACLQVLLDCGIVPNQITYIKPRYKDGLEGSTTMFNDTYVT